MRSSSSLIILLGLLLSFSAYGQTQQGYVKTLGRPNKKGEPLSGVSIRIKGEHNPVLSKEDGTLTLLLTGKKNGDAYTLQEVQKKGYELNETDVIGRQYAYSEKVPLTIVMVASSQLKADKQRIENNAFAVAEKNYKEKLALFEKQKRESKITEEQYRVELLDLQDKFEKYQLLIDGLAEHYAHVDYDELSDKEQEINICIENGELGRADSLISMLFDPIDVLKQNKKTLAQINHQISKANSIIDKANKDMAVVLKQQEKDANYLYQLYTIALARFDKEKASQYIEIRAELDTSNLNWQVDAGKYYEEYLANYKKAILFYKRAIALSEGYDLNTAYYKSCLARQYDNMGKSDEAMRLFFEAIWTWINIYTGEEYKIEEGDDMWINLHAIGQHGASVLGGKESIPPQIRLYIYECYKDLESMFLRLQNDEEYGFQFAMFSNSLRVENDELSIILHKYERTPYGNYIDDEGEDKTELYYSIYIDYLQQKNGKESLPVADAYFDAAPFAEDSKAYYIKAMEIFVKHYGRIHPKVLRCKSQILFELVNSKEYQEAVSYAESEIFPDARILYDDDNQFWESINWNLGYAYQNQKAYHEAINCYNRYLKIVEKARESDPIYTATIYKRLCQIFLKTGEPQRMRSILKAALDIFVEREDAMDYTDEYVEVYEMGVASGWVPEIMTNIAFVIRIDDQGEDIPTKSQGMKGEYLLLEFGDWNITSRTSLFKNITKMKDKSKDIVVMQDDTISKYHFNNEIGAYFDLKYVGEEEKRQIITSYKEWKEK
jgi:hypothetical protein